MKTKFTVKEFAQLCNVSIRTIKYYEEIGLIQPSSVLENGYRIYDIHQLDQVSTILLLKDHGFSLSKIKEILKQDDLKSQYENMKLQKEYILQKKQQLIQKENLIDYTMNQIENYYEHLNEPFIEYLEKQRIEPEYIDSKNPSVFMINYLLDGYRSGLLVDPIHNKAIGSYQTKEDGSICLEGKCLCLYYYGNPYDWEKPISKLKESALSSNISLSMIYGETILENADSNIYLIKFMMKVE